VKIVGEKVVGRCEKLNNHEKLRFSKTKSNLFANIVLPLNVVSQEKYLKSKRATKNHCSF
jgi:hypothetical protein